MYYLSTRALVDANREALRNKTLAALHKVEPDCLRKCVYDNRNGKYCAIGVSLPKEELTRIYKEGMNNAPYSYIGVCYQSDTIARITQKLHDTWLLKRSFDAAPYLKTVHANFLIQFSNKRINKKKFETWLNYLEENGFCKDLGD